MKFEILTLFPDYFSLSLRQSLIGKAREKQLFDIETINLRDFATDKHRTVDAPPFGGGGGMVMMLEPLDACLQSVGIRPKAETQTEARSRVVLTSAAGKPFTNDRAVEYSLLDRLTIICGHYDGVDERLLELYEIDEVSIGDYVLSGGEPAAAVIIDAVARLMPGVLGNFESALDDSYMDGLLGAPSYTRPAEYKGLKVPEELVSGNHALIKKFRREQAIAKCKQNRPELIDRLESDDS
ncbi:tRNA (guanosine(37)-N1)-methyltransferase TrmD [candidate division GN15 bacterium]|nr:tRNA (guanosine(37)-N1)-methyltransferase TrmD [candidate division GN15 bacterium]